MAEVSITTPRGVHLAGTFEPGPTAAAVLFAHGFLSDRHSAYRFDALAATYREAGYATLQFDFSGCGASDDDVVTVAGEVEDLRSASAWLTEQGYPVQAVHAHSFGTVGALRAQPRDVVTMVLTGALTGPMNYPWGQIFAPAQVDELEEHGFTRVPDDNEAGVREFNVISRETLADYSLIDQAELLGKVRVPVLMLYGGMDEEATELVSLGREGMPLLPEGSRLEVVPGAEHGLKDRIDIVGERGVAWFSEHLAGVPEPDAGAR
ncbi:MAG: alpha/beta hydrolase family protein [Georgenia sp.]